MTILSLRHLSSSISNTNYTDKSITWSVFDHTTQLSTKFDFKSDALFFKKKLPHATVYFNWYDSEMSMLDWTKEPEESYSELCKQRAQELRDTYDYIRLWYSGGADSHSALLSFVKNNIHIDEIVVLLYPDKNVSNIVNSTANEMLIAAFPQLKNIENIIPKTKITVVDADENDIHSWFNSSSKNLLSTLDCLDGDGYGSFYLDTNWGISKILNQTNLKNWCDLHGGTKARLFKNKERWYSYFVDSGLSTFYMSARSEDFFISRTVPKLFLKTVYNYKRYHELNQSDDNYVNTMYADMSNHPEYNRALGREEVHTIAAKKVYFATHNPAHWQKLLISNAKCVQFYNNVINTSEGQYWYQNHVAAQKILVEEYSDFWNVDSQGNPVPPLGHKGHLSKFYCLNDGLIYDSTQTGYK